MSISPPAPGDTRSFEISANISIVDVASSILINSACRHPPEGFTDQDSLNSALRLDLRPGEWVLWSGRPHRFESLRGTCARIRDSNSTELREVDVAEIRGMTTLALEDLDERLDGLRTSGDPTWQTAMQREEIIRQVMVQPGPAKPRIRSAAESQKVSTRTIQRLIARYKSSAQTTS
jgi:hypothetical protein